ncbi:MAG: hypothetical protein ACTSPB_07455 [Candidatus Thorarchaeota archaeon]
MHPKIWEEVVDSALEELMEEINASLDPVLDEITAEYNLKLEDRDQLRLALERAYEEIEREYPKFRMWML